LVKALVTGRLCLQTAVVVVDEGSLALSDGSINRPSRTRLYDLGTIVDVLLDTAPNSRRSGNIYAVSNITRSMATAVKVGEDAKSRLEELQAEIRLRAGTRVTQQELLTRLIDDAYESRTEVIDSFRESTVPLSDAEKRQMQEGRVSSGVETDEDDIDDILYR
jgi:hypothetical protein